uniref:SSD domain-containing protein n=1 Tax=Setaria digitata TaxID=48799 RepID=A0A915Q1C6_9BILA
MLSFCKNESKKKEKGTGVGTVGGDDTLSGSDNSKRSKRDGEYKSLEKIRLPPLYNQDGASLTPISQRQNYIEEPESESSSSSNQKNNTGKALVRRITNELQVTQLEKEKIKSNGDTIKVESKIKERPVYKMYAFRFVEAGLRRALWYFGRSVPSKKALFLLLPIAFVLLSLVGPIVHRERLNLSLPIDTFVSCLNDQYPASGHSNLRMTTRGILAFNGSNPAYNVVRRNSPAEFAIIMRSKNYGSAIAENSLNSFRKLSRSVKSIVVSYERMNLTWLEMCRDTCTGKDDPIQQIMESNLGNTLTYPETIISPKNAGNITRLFLGLVMGGVETDGDGVITYARSLSANFRLKDNFRSEILDEFSKQFVRKMSEEEEALQQTVDADINWWSYREFASEVVSGLLTVHYLLIPSAALLMLACLIASFGVNGYQSKPVLGFVIGVILIVSCLAGFFVQLTGVGIGILMLFTLEDTWTKYSNVACDPVEKLSLILSWDAPCTAITAFIIIVSFAVIGSTTKSPYLQYMSFVLAAGVAVLLIFALLFFSVFLYVAGRRETKGVKWYQCFRSGDTHFAPRTISEFSDSSIEMLHEKLIDTKPSFSRATAAAMANSYLRCPVAFVFAVYLVLAFWGCRDVRIDLKEEYFLSKESQSRNFIENYRAEFGQYEEFLELVFDEPIDYLDPHRKDEILAILDWPIQNQLATRSVSWLKDFVRFESTTIYDINPDTFVPIIGIVFLTAENYKKYRNDIIFDKFQTRIIGSRMYIELTAKGVQERLFVIDELLNKARSVGISMFIKTPFIFAIQHDLQVMSTVIIAFSLLLCCVCTLSLFLFGIPSLTVLVLLSNLSVIIGVIGFATYWMVPINAITLFMALAGNALTTTIVSYFCYNFATAGKRQKTGEQRVRYSFQSCLLPITLACFVPLLTYLPLLIAGLPVMIHIFKILILSSFITYIHLLLFLPNVMIFLTEQIPSFCSSLQDICDECCCYCFDIEEDSGSIYYIPTGGRSTSQLNGLTKQYSYALAVPPTTRGMLLPPKTAGYLPVAATVAQTLVPDVLPYQSNPIVSIENYRSSKSRRRDNGSEQSLSLPSSPRVTLSNRQTPRRERRRIATENHSINDESIYEEPPSLSSNLPESHSPIQSRRCDGRKPERRQSHSSTSRYVLRDERSPGRDSAIELRSNWKQYLIDGNLRQPTGAIVSTSPSSIPQPMLYYSTPAYRAQPPRYTHDKRF